MGRYIYKISSILCYSLRSMAYSDVVVAGFWNVDGTENGDSILGTEDSAKGEPVLLMHL